MNSMFPLFIALSGTLLSACGVSDPAFVSYTTGYEPVAYTVVPAPETVPVTPVPPTTAAVPPVPAAPQAAPPTVVPQTAATAVPVPAPATQPVASQPAPQPVNGPAEVTPPTAAPLPRIHIPASSGDRAERRRLKAEAFARQIDSLVHSRYFLFVPDSMQEMPGGTLGYLYNDFYYLGVVGDHIEVHLPTVRGGTVRYFEILNYDTFDMRNYRVSTGQSGLTVSFDCSGNGQSGEECAFNLSVSTVTGEAILNLLSGRHTMQYIGSLQGIRTDR